MYKKSTFRRVVGLATAFVGRTENVGGKIENAHCGSANVRGGNGKLGGLL